MFLFHHNSGHASAIARDFNISKTATINQLNRLEKVGILVSVVVGKARVYSLNPKSPYTKPLSDLIKVRYYTIPLEEREKIFKRRRPRAKGKNIL